MLNEDLTHVKTLDTEGNYLRSALDLPPDFIAFGCSKLQLYIFSHETLEMLSSLRVDNGVNCLGQGKEAEVLLVGEDDGIIELCSYPYLQSKKLVTLQNLANIFCIKSTSRKDSELIIGTEKGVVFGDLLSNLTFTENKKETYLNFKCVRGIEEY